MTESTKNFIVRHKNLIRDNDFDSLYKEANSEGGFRATRELTKAFLDSDINPLTYMTEVPDFYCDNHRAITNIVIPGNITKIGRKAFYNCRYLKTVTIKEGTKEIDSYAFSECWSLLKVILPESVEKIDDYAFFGTPDVIFHVKEGSYAYTYAKDNNFKVKLIR